MMQDAAEPIAVAVSTDQLAGYDGVSSRDLSAKRKQRSLWGNAWRQFRRHKLAMAGLIVLTVITIACFVGSRFYSREIDAVFELPENLSPSGVFISSSFPFIHLDQPVLPFGTDPLGQDILARTLWGGRISLMVGFLAAAVAIGIGTLVGAVSGFFGGPVDSFLMRVTDLFISLPQLPLLLLISYLYRDQFYDYFDERFDNGNMGIFVLIVGVISLLAWMSTARLVRASFISLKEKEFVEAARAIGAPRRSLIFKHILPNVLSPIIVAATLAVGEAIIFESALSFLGLGFPSDVPTWGRLLFDAQQYFQFYPYQALFPGMMIFLTVLSINFIGDGLRDALDPRKVQ